MLYPGYSLGEGSHLYRDAVSIFYSPTRMSFGYKAKNQTVIIIIIIIMHKPESVRENATYKVLQVFEIQTDHLILARRPNLELIREKERSFRQVDVGVPGDFKEKMKKRRKERKLLGSC